MLICYNLTICPLCQTLSNAALMSKNGPWTIFDDPQHDLIRWTMQTNSQIACLSFIYDILICAMTKRSFMDKCFPHFRKRFAVARYEAQPTASFSWLSLALLSSSASVNFNFKLEAEIALFSISPAAPPTHQTTRKCLFFSCSSDFSENWVK